MRKMKRSRGLSGTPAEHEGDAQYNYQDASIAFRDALAVLADKKPACFKAFGDYSMGMEDFGAYQYNYSGGRLAETVDGALQLKNLNSLRKKTVMAFQKACLLPPRLNGLGARRKSRR